MKHLFDWKRILCVSCAVFMASLFSACSMLTFQQTGKETVYINEVVSSNKQSFVDEVIGTPDWIELFNSSDQEIDLSGWGLSDNMKNFHKFVFPEGTVIAPGAYIMVYAADDPGEVAEGRFCAGFGLSKSGDYLFLTDKYYNLIQQMEIPYLITDVSYARKADATYGYCASTTPGSQNTTDILDTLSGMFNSQDLTALAITEVMPVNPDGAGWAELYNTGTQAIRLENYYLSDTESNLMRWQLPAATLEAGAYTLIYLSGDEKNENGIHAPFKLGSEDSCLILTDITGTVRTKLQWELGIPGGISVVAGKDDTATYCAFPTPGAANATNVFQSLMMSDMDASDPVRINEVLRSNQYSVIDADGDREEWVELYNSSASAVSLQGYFLSDNPDNLFKWALPDIVIPAGGYQLVFLSGKDRTEGELHASFGLADDENTLYLMNANGMRVDNMPLSGVIGSNVSVGRDGDGNLRYYAQPTPGSKNAYGFETADSIGFFNKRSVFISEVSAVAAAKSGKRDWIELYNGSDAEMDLSGWYLSDDESNPTLWQIPAMTIGAKQYAVIEASSRASEQNGQTAAFGISPSGETLLLSDPEGNVVDRFSTGTLTPERTAGRLIDDATVARVFFTTPTMGEANSESSLAGYASQPIFSEAELYHTAPFQLSMRCAAGEDAAIYYTLDGSVPGSGSQRYTAPLTIDKNTVLRAVAYRDGLLESEITTATYIFEQPHKIPVVCIATEPEKIKKIYSADSFADKIEYSGVLSYYETDGSLGVTFPAGIKPKGAGTLVYRQKSLGIHLRAAYGQSSVSYPFFENCTAKTFSSLVLRNGGQDRSNARIRDSFFSRAAIGSNLDYAATQPVAVYVNGEYYGLYDFNEDLNKDYLVNHYQVAEDTVETIRRNSFALDGSNRDFLRVRDYALNRDLSDDSVFQEFSQWVDVAYFTDYMITQTYFVNSDMFNQKYWHTNDNKVKWRPIYYDLDFGLTSSKRDMIAQYFNVNGVPSADGSLTYMDIYIGLRKNAGWRKMAAERYVELICTQFAPDRLIGILDAMQAEIADEIPRQIARWNTPDSVAKWESEIEFMREVIRRRPENSLEQVKRFFDVTQTDIDTWVAKYTKTS